MPLPAMPLPGQQPPTGKQSRYTNTDMTQPQSGRQCAAHACRALPPLPLSSRAGSGVKGLASLLFLPFSMPLLVVRKTLGR